MGGVVGVGGVVDVVCSGGFTDNLAFSVYLNRGTLPNYSAMRPSVNRRCITRFTVRARLARAWCSIKNIIS